MRAILPKEATRAGDRKADHRKGVAEAGGGDRPAGGRFPSGDHGTKGAATAGKTASPPPTPVPDPREALRRELDRWCACRRFVYQFSLMAKPTAKKRNTGRGGKGALTPRMWRPTPITPPKLGLAAVKHAQQLAERAAATDQQGRAFVALAHVVAEAGGGGWPETMQRELQACRTPQERQAWAEKWGEVLSGRAERNRHAAPERPAAGAGRASIPRAGHDG
jgi:hypothetical protein